MHGEGNIKIKGYIISLILDNGYINIFFWGGGVYVLLFSLLNRYIITKIDIFMEMHRILIQYVSTASDVWLKNRYLDSCFGLLLYGTCTKADL